MVLASWMRSVTNKQAWICVLALGLSDAAVSTAQAGWPFFSNDGPPRGTPEWYEMHAGSPPGARQRYAYGKMWPAEPRPAGPPQPFIHKYHSAHYWPNPYCQMDQDVVRSVMQSQVDNGWQEATTLHIYHFDAQTHELNSSGQEHLRWLLTHAPVQYRTAHVAAGPNPEINSQRVMAVEQHIVALIGQPGTIPVLLRMTDPTGTPADQVKNIFDQAEKGRTPPIIPFMQATGQSGN